jgi:protein-S-isoprenylcysteine O-methyltransferase Ste14
MGLFLAFLATPLLIITAKIEEIENIAYFGNRYLGYMKHTQMFVPFFF